MQLQDFDTTVRHTAKVLSSERLTTGESKAEVREIKVEVESDSFRANAGQSVGVLAPGRREIGQESHFRLYSIADISTATAEDHLCISLCVRRCTYIDEFSGEEYPGVASNYLCDLVVGDRLTITGPYDQAFVFPEDPDAVLILIGAGTGIAPFRAFVRQAFSQRPDFRGRVILFHGAETGLDLLYRNRQRDDFAMYYDRETFDAIDALSNRPGWSSAIDWASAMDARAAELCQLLADSRTHVFLAGLRSIRDELDRVLAGIVGSDAAWLERKSQLTREGRWAELLY